MCETMIGTQDYCLLFSANSISSHNYTLYALFYKEKKLQGSLGI